MKRCRVLMVALAAGAAVGGGSRGHPFEILSSCGSFGPVLTGIQIDAPHTQDTRLRVAETVRIPVRIGRPLDVTPPSRECPSQTRGQAVFPRVQWSWTADTIDVHVLECRCAIERTFRDQDTLNAVARNSDQGLYVFEITAVRPGRAAFSVTGFVTGPCTGGSDRPVSECGPYALDLISILVS